MCGFDPMHSWLGAFVVTGVPRCAGRLNHCFMCPCQAVKHHSHNCITETHSTGGYGSESMPLSIAANRGAKVVTPHKYTRWNFQSKI